MSWLDYGFNGVFMQAKKDLRRGRAPLFCFGRGSVNRWGGEPERALAPKGIKMPIKRRYFVKKAGEKL
jgi:hypothetical protein